MLRSIKRHKISDRVVQGEAKHLLVSFCNMKRSRQAPLAIVDLAKSSWRWLNLNGTVFNAEKQLPGPLSQGGRALCWHEDYICAAYVTASRLGEVTLLEPYEGYSVRARFPAPGGVHSAVSYKGDIYMTTSQQDSVYRASANKKGAWFVEKVWTMPGSSGKEDESHVNGIAVIKSKLCVSAIGQKKAGSIGREQAGPMGFVYDIESEKYIYDSVRAPHSLMWDGKRVWTCASLDNEVLTLDGECHEFPTTYLRGLVVDDATLYAASSKKRTRSLSKGTETGISREKRGECSLWRKPLKGEAEKVADFSEYRDEIYDLLPL